MRAEVDEDHTLERITGCGDLGIAQREKTDGSDCCSKECDLNHRVCNVLRCFCVEVQLDYRNDCGLAQQKK